VEYDPGQPYPTASSGGTPPSWYVQVDTIEIEDYDEFSASAVMVDIAEKFGWSEERSDWIDEAQEKTGKLLKAVREYIMYHWSEKLEDALIEACE
jgi:hypothetical protein